MSKTPLFVKNCKEKSISVGSSSVIRKYPVLVYHYKTTQDLTDLRHVQMDVCSLQELILRLFLGQETLGEGVRDLGRLFHDVTEISRQRHRALAVGFQLAQRSRHHRLDVER